ncbi:hypothetical protein RB600_006670 [Gaeumannomyces tritici]
MAVSRELAFEWECGHCTDLTFSFPDDIKKAFIEARTKPWESRIKNYWAWYHEKPESTLLSAQDKLDMQRHLSRTFSIEPQAGDGFFVRRLKRLIGNQRLESERRRRIGTGFHGFTSLPAELRTMIYRHALVSPNGKFAMPPKRDGKFEKIQKHHITYSADRFATRYQLEDQSLLALGLLLCVSKAVQSEAEAIFFGENNIVFLNNSATASADDSEWWARSLSRVGPALRSISIATISGSYWDFRAIFGDHNNQFCWDSGLESLRDHLDAMDGTPHADRWIQYVHNNMDSTGCPLDNLVGNFPNLNLLEVCLQDATCILGCCRRVDAVCDELMEYMKDCRMPKTIKFLGLENTDARTIKEYLEGPLTDFTSHEGFDEIRLERCTAEK